ncbi:MAG: cysteine synthase family protein [Candidatus Bipolaricaulis sp.]|nr:cysteine synthase family protein [Candidatus Bipolaricaulis sp.]MDD5646779.1 cysteine synthase family protein [Candidatus Bipolaricaulis sp.]
MRTLSLLESIGNTPLVELSRLMPRGSRARIVAKLEGANPGGSVKDRPAKWMIEHAEETGELSSGKTILEPTSGNTGIALAMIGAAKGYRVRLCMPECVSTERRHILEAFGAELVLTPAREKTDGAIRVARDVARKDPGRYYMPNQFENPYNARSHYDSTGPEILAQTDGEVDAFVAGIGTAGTLMGVSMFLKERKPGTAVVGVEPVRGHAIQGLKNLEESIVPGIYDARRLDAKLRVGDEESFSMTRRLATDEGLFVGMSSGAAVVGALKVAAELRSGTVVVLLPDRGDRYLSTSLFRSICGDCPP